MREPRNVLNEDSSRSQLAHDPAVLEPEASPLGVDGGGADALHPPGSGDVNASEVVLAATSLCCAFTVASSAGIVSLLVPKSKPNIRPAEGGVKIFISS
ncbi:MAG: hypothetical protein ABSB82_17090 [Terriglobia bacterium]|jgi:hypothetical protein